MNNYRLPYLFLILTLITTLLGCNNAKESILSRDKMVEVLHDIQLAESIYQLKYNDFITREQKDALIDNVLKKHGVSQAQLDSSLVWYSDNAEIYMRVNDSIISTLKTDLKLTEALMSKTNILAQNRNNSIIENHVFLTNEQPILSFSMDSLLTANYQGFELEFKTLGFFNDTTTTSEFSVTYRYLDTVIVDRQLIKDNITYKSVSPLANNILQGISGYIYANPKGLGERKALIYDILLRNKEILPE